MKYPALNILRLIWRIIRNKDEKDRGKYPYSRNLHNKMFESHVEEKYTQIQTLTTSRNSF